MLADILDKQQAGLQIDPLECAYH